MGWHEEADPDDGSRANYSIRNESSDLIRGNVRKMPRYDNSQGPFPARRVAVSEMARRGWDCERAPRHRQRGALPLPIGRSNADDRRGTRRREALRPRRGRRRVGMRSPAEALRPIDAFSFQSPSRWSRTSRRDPLDDQGSRPPAELRIRRLEATSRPVHKGRTQNEMPRPWMRLQWKTLIPGHAKPAHRTPV